MYVLNKKQLAENHVRATEGYIQMTMMISGGGVWAFDVRERYDDVSVCVKQVREVRLAPLSWHPTATC
jgi:hypothetical protein